MKYQLNDVFENWATTGGIFTLLSAVEGGHDLPWTVSAGLLDFDYHGNHSGDKLVSPLLYKLIKQDGGTLSIIHASQIATLIYNRFIDNWIKRYEALAAEYNPLENYAMTENETREGTNTGTVGNVETIDRDTTADTDTTGTGSIYGYDSQAPSPSDKQETAVNSSGTEDTQRTATRTDNLANSEERELTRSGNIGVTTSQQMLESELNIRTYDFFESVYKDIDKVLTLAVY